MLSVHNAFFFSNFWNNENKSKKLLHIVEWASGNIYLDSNGDRKPQFWLLDLGPDNHFRRAYATSISLSEDFGNLNTVTGHVLIGASTRFGIKTSNPQYDNRTSIHKTKHGKRKLSFCIYCRRSRTLNPLSGVTGLLASAMLHWTYHAVASTAANVQVRDVTLHSTLSTPNYIGSS